MAISLGVITDGISRALDQALAVAAEHGLNAAELQYVGSHEVGDADFPVDADTAHAARVRGLPISCLSRHLFSGMPVLDTEPGDTAHSQQMAELTRCLDLARAWNVPLVRIMCFRKEMILFGDRGAEEWVVTRGAWTKTLQLLEPAVQMASDRGQQLVLETGNSGMINSAALARRLLDEMGRPEALQILWDPCNCLYAGEPAWPDGCEALADGGLGHIHIKDAVVRPTLGSVSCRALGEGDMGPSLPGLVEFLRASGYAGSISLESVYRPVGGTFVDGFRESVGTLRELFG